MRSWHSMFISSGLVLQTKDLCTGRVGYSRRKKRQLLFSGAADRGRIKPYILNVEPGHISSKFGTALLAVVDHGTSPFNIAVGQLFPKYFWRLKICHWFFNMALGCIGCFRPYGWTLSGVIMATSQPGLTGFPRPSRTFRSCYVKHACFVIQVLEPKPLDAKKLVCSTYI